MRDMLPFSVGFVGPRPVAAVVVVYGWVGFGSSAIMWQSQDA